MMIRTLVNDVIYVYGFSLIYVIIFNTPRRFVMDEL